MAKREKEFEGRLAYAFLDAAAALARGLDLPFGRVSSFLQLAELRSLQKSNPGLTQKQLADKIGVSPRTFARLLEATRGNFFAPDATHTLPRRIEFLLWSGAKSEARICQLLADEPREAIIKALRRLEKDGRVQLTQGRTPMYCETRSTHRLVSGDLDARLDGVTNFVRVAKNVVLRRFRDGDEDAFARTVGFRVRKRDIAKVRAFYEEQLWPLLERLDREALDADDAQELGLVYGFTPMTEERES